MVWLKNCPNFEYYLKISNSKTIQLRTIKELCEITSFKLNEINKLYPVHENIYIEIEYQYNKLSYYNVYDIKYLLKKYVINYKLDPLKKHELLSKLLIKYLIKELKQSLSRYYTYKSYKLDNMSQF